MDVAHTHPVATIEYARPAPSRFPLYYTLYTFLTLVPALLMIVALVFIAPQFKEVFKDFKTTLPVMTIATLQLSDAFRTGFWIVPLLLAMLLPILPARSSARQEQGSRRLTLALLYAALMAAVTVLVVIIFAFSLYLPFYHLIQSVSGGAGGGGAP
jgi:type II secretory pathway component PulF